MSLSILAEQYGIDSELLLFSLLEAHKKNFPNLISRRQCNDRKKYIVLLYEYIRKQIAQKTDGGENYFCIDSKPLAICRNARAKRCKIGKDNFERAPSIVYCASQRMYYYGYKLHILCGLSGVIHSYELTKASVDDRRWVQEMKYTHSHRTIIGDKGYLSAQIQLDLFETAYIQLEVSYRTNQKQWKPTYKPFVKAKKRIEMIFLTTQRPIYDW